MAKPASGSTKESPNAVLSIPYEAFYKSILPIGMECVVTSEEENRYAVKFPGVVGYSGTFHVKKSRVTLT